MFKHFKNLFDLGGGRKEDLAENLSTPNANDNVFDDTSYIENLLDENIRLSALFGNCSGANDNACKHL